MRSVFDKENKHSLKEFFTGFTPVNYADDCPVRGFKAKAAYTKGWTNVDKQETLEGIYARSSSFGGVINQDTTYVVDVDEPEAAALILDIIKKENVQCRVHKTTKGIHIFFKKGGRLEVKGNGKKQGRITNLTPICGLAPGKVDYFPGGLIVLKLNGEERQVLYETDEIGECPAWLQAWSNKKERCENDYTDFLGLKEGSRNSSLFPLSGKCKTRGLEYEEFVDTVRIINTYLLADPVDETEFATITRKEAWDEFEVPKGRGRPKGSTKKDKPLNLVKTADGKVPFPRDEETEKPAFDVVAKELIDGFHIKRLEGQIRVYNGGAYTKPKVTNGGNVLEHYLEEHYVGLSNRTCLEVLGSIERQCLFSTEESSSRYINFKNGIFDLETGEFLEHNPDIITVNQIPHNFNPNADTTAYEHFLGGLACGDPEIQRVLEEIVGACMYRGTVSQLAFVLTGSGQNGKSTYNKLLENVLATTDNYCSIDPKDFTTDVSRFKLSGLYGKTANICPDISSLYIRDPSNFKRVITGDRLNAEFKGQDPFEFNPYATHVFSVNEIPRMSDAGGATTRRLLFIPFNAVFEKDDTIEQKIRYDEGIAEAAVLKGILGLQRVLREKTFTIPEVSKKIMEEYKIENDSVRAFLDAFKDDDGEYHIWNHSTRAIYEDYRSFCFRQNLEPVSLTKMTRGVKLICRAETIEKRLENREKGRVFVK